MVSVRVSGKWDEGGLLAGMGEAIRAARLERNISQEALAALAGIDRSHMGTIERGKRNITILNLNKIAAALGVQPSELLARAGF